MGLFGLTDREAYMQSNGIKTSLLQELRQYESMRDRTKEQIQVAYKSGNKTLANQLAGNIVRYNAKIARLQGEVGDVEAINMHALSEMNEVAAAELNISGLIKYGEKESEKLRKLKVPYASKLRSATINLAKSQEINASAVEGIVSEAYVPQAAKDVLEDIVADMETKEKEKAAEQAKVKEKAAAARAEGT